MSQRLSTMLSEITDPNLRERIQSEFDEATKNKKFGLVFERHMPEHIALPGVKVRRGLKVLVRGTDTVLTVAKVRAGIASTVLAHPTDDSPQESVEHPVADLVVAAEFGDPVYPGLTQVGTAEGPDTNAKSPSHIVINAENHHALQMLQWTHEEAVDCIYIDPPYNTGNKTWKYNDNYVGEQDNFRHSKWLSFMEKRLVLARKLLKPTGVIVLSIDDSEQHRLRMLMDGVFGERNFVANLIWRGKGGGQDSASYAKQHEYAIVFARDATKFTAGRSLAEMKAGEFNLTDLKSGRRYKRQLVRKWGSNSLRTDRPTMFYPVTAPDGLKCYPRHADGTEGCWRWEKKTFDRHFGNGDVEFVSTPEGWVPYQRIWEESAIGKTVPFGTLLPEDIGATAQGSLHLKDVMSRKVFDFPKPVALIEHLINMTTKSSSSVILDFFGGSGTTAEAVIRLNAEDGGTRQSILVTNNELAAKDDAALRKAGHEPGSAEYESLGVFHHVTKPRIETVVTGIRQDGSKYSDGLPGRVTFFDLEYLDANVLADDMAFTAINPLLWMRAGAVGTPPAAPANDPEYVHENYAVLRDMDSARGFRAAVDQPEITHAFAVTNSTSEFAKWNDGLPAHVDGARLYEHYLHTFTINTLDAAR